jgi:hypothetical protein
MPSGCFICVAVQVLLSLAAQSPEPGVTVGVAIRASSAIQNGPNYLETSIDCGSRYALGASIGVQK